MFWKFWYIEIGEIHTPNVKSPYKAGRLVDLVLLTYGGGMGQVCIPSAVAAPMITGSASEARRRMWVCHVRD
jgi:hypothetical protein